MKYVIDMIKFSEEIDALLKNLDKGGDNQFKFIFDSSVTASVKIIQAALMSAASPADGVDRND